MGYQKMNQEEQESLEERLNLVLERIHGIPQEQSVKEEFRNYFVRTASFIELTQEVLQKVLQHTIEDDTLAECREMNESLYRDISPQQYERSYANPEYAVRELGDEYGRLLCMLYAELRALISYAYEGKLLNYTILCELFVQIYASMADEEGTMPQEVQQEIYWFFHDYSEVFTEQSTLEMIDPEYDFFTDIVMHADMKDLRYLYRYGEPIGDNELRLAAYFGKLPEEKIQAMADTYTEGYRIGFITTGKDISVKSSVNIEYAVGMERMVRAAIRNFEKMGLKPTIFRDSVSSFKNRGNGKRGCYATAVNKQFDYDHKSDKALYLDKAFVERRLETLRASFEEHRRLAAEYAGPAAIEVFGEASFTPVNKKDAWNYTKKQNELNVYNASETGQITNQYIKGEERSFTIIAYPLPEIGPEFEAIFAKTVEINTLDYTAYQSMQQKIIDVLDLGIKAYIKGKGENRTDLTVAFYPLKNKEKETVFENCVADVNIPVGEVFTSPALKGTTGTLHVSGVYLNDLHYEQLEIQFTDGMITDYNCANFASEEENKKYIYDNILMHHDTLPMGEFAIGTNTTAYKMARDFAVADKLPILIAEKTGPHFAVGDTCYSHAEDTAVYNPDGKEIVARDNAISLLRTENTAKAYFNCHTDITIPYDELDSIYVEHADGTGEYVIRDGLFAVKGTEELNQPLIS